MKNDFLLLGVILSLVFVAFIIGSITLIFFLRGKYGEFYKLPEFNEFITNLEDGIDTSFEESYKLQKKEQIEDDEQQQNVDIRYEYNVTTKETITSPNTVNVVITAPAENIYVNEEPLDKNDNNDFSVFEQEFCYDFEIDDINFDFDKCLSFEDHSKISKAYLSYSSAKRSLEIYEEYRNTTCGDDPESSSCEFWDERADEQQIEFTNEKRKLESLLDDY